ncbi:hypothetical protein BKI49_26090 [Streptomyces sp. Tue6028]|uniref:hypothetical protein n=1 Tax=Streptomyces sp. Tue6028 TaxID=2036037 RepID=UPI000BB2D053|nr:hypothetical protein [Streptomyces sp. Tue6028]PBC61045.1 hypothetical protein BKI49_26090 [Streptomyces sp. Tue6028]
MGTKTVDEAGTDTGTGATSDEKTVDVTKEDVTEADGSVTDETTSTGAGTGDTAGADDTTGDDTAGDDTPGDGEGATGVGQGAAAVVSAGLGVVSLTGSWVATVAAARETLVGQLQTSSSASVAKQVKEVYGDAWAATALVGGLFALAALIVGVVVLARPAFGAPGRPQAAWIKSVAWAGVALGVIGLVLAVAKYSDILLGLPSTG